MSEIPISNSQAGLQAHKRRDEEYTTVPVTRRPNGINNPPEPTDDLIEGLTGPEISKILELPARVIGEAKEGDDVSGELAEVLPIKPPIISAEDVPSGKG